MFTLNNYFTNDWYTFAVFFILICLSLLSMEMIKKRYNIPTELMRKIVHVSVGVLIIASPFIFKSNGPPILLASFFFILNTVAIKLNFLQSIHGTERISYGTVYFPLTFMILSWFYWDKPIVFISAMSILTFADTMAAVVGQTSSIGKKIRIWNDDKSIRGMITMFSSSTLLVLLVVRLTTNTEFSFGTMVLASIITAVGATVGEAVSSRGSDNLSAPLLAAFMLDLSLSLRTDYLVNLSIWTGASLVIFLYLLRFRVLKLNGMLVAYIMGVIIFGIGGSSWIIPMVTFFITSSILSKVSPAKRSNKAKGSERDMFQVLANGGIPLAIAILYQITGLSWLYLVFLAGVAAATADTWATEIGGFSIRDPRHILNFKSVPKGTSGGISIFGTLGSLLGAALIASTGFIFGISTFSALIVVISGFSGSIIDSVLGATAQSRFKCNSCSKTTEKRIHCSVPTTHMDGMLWIDNDMVNFLNTASSSAILFIIMVTL